MTIMGKKNHPQLISVVMTPNTRIYCKTIPSLVPPTRQTVTPATESFRMSAALSSRTVGIIPPVCVLSVSGQTFLRRNLSFSLSCLLVGSVVKNGHPILTAGLQQARDLWPSESFISQTEDDDDDDDDRHPLAYSSQLM